MRVILHFLLGQALNPFPIVDATTRGNINLLEASLAPSAMRPAKLPDEKCK